MRTERDHSFIDDNDVELVQGPDVYVLALMDRLYWESLKLRRQGAIPPVEGWRGAGRLEDETLQPDDELLPEQRDNRTYGGREIA